MGACGHRRGSKGCMRKDPFERVSLSFVRIVKKHAHMKKYKGKNKVLQIHNHTIKSIKSNQIKTKMNLNQKIEETKATLDTQRDYIDNEGHTNARQELTTDGTVNSMMDVMEERYEFNAIINPIVDALRKIHGQNCKIEMLDERCGKTQFIKIVFEENGPLRMVPNPEDREQVEKCFSLINGLLEQKFNKMGITKDEKKKEIKRNMLRNRFYVEGETQYEAEFELERFIYMESQNGYNSVVEEQLRKK